MKNESVLHYSEEKDLNWLKDLGFPKFESTDSQAIYRISPVAIQSLDKFIFPKVKVSSQKDFPSTHSQPLSKIEIAQIKNKFEAKENVFGSSVKANENVKSDFLDVVAGSSQEERDEYTKLQKPDEDEDGRKHLDKYNLLKAFKFVYDPYHSKIELNNEEDYSESNLEFASVDKKIESLFGSKDN
jgi:hypothetical protein